MCNHPLAKLTTKAVLEIRDSGYCPTCSSPYPYATIYLRCECGFEYKETANGEYGSHEEWHAFVVAQSLEA